MQEASGKTPNIALASRACHCVGAPASPPGEEGRAIEDLPGGGTRMTDTVHYRLPLGILGLLALPLVRGDVARIFAYRREVLEAWARDRTE